MVERNPNMSKLKAGYLFPEIARRKKELLAKEPASKIISLGIGDTTEPIPEHIARAMSEAALELGTPEGYSGYGQDQGDGELRKRISEVIYKGVISDKEIFVSDGAKCDIGRLQFFFGPHVKIAVLFSIICDALRHAWYSLVKFCENFWRRQRAGIGH